MENFLTPQKCRSYKGESSFLQFSQLFSGKNNKTANFFLLRGILAFVFFLLFIPFSRAINIVDLSCEYFPNPMGINVPSPRLSWRMDSGRRGEYQTAYRILVASSREMLEKNQGDLWDSGKVISDKSINVSYKGKSLNSFDQCFWKVRVWDMEGNPSAWSAPGMWTMGIGHPEDLKARWITSKTEHPSLMLRRDFEVKQGLRRAVAVVSGLGHYEMTINGEKVSEDVLAPGWTKYDKTVLYDVHDVTGYLKEGVNAAGFFLGNGMYNVQKGRYVKFTGSFGPKKLIAQIRLIYRDGSTENIISDGTWSTHAGPVTFSNIFGGEDFDARLFQEGWDSPGFSGTDWLPAVETHGPGGQLKGWSCSAPPVSLFDTLVPVKVIRIDPRVTLYDLGQNAAQMPRIIVSGDRGSSVTIRPAELLKEDNTVDQRSIGGDISMTYILDGSGSETWAPRFFYLGYRYLQVECNPAPSSSDPPVVESLQGRVVHTSSTPIGRFETSNELINRIYRMIRWAQRSNMVSVMTDCPHREKLGWLEQTHLNGPALRYNYDLNIFFRKLMNDMADSQLENGLIPDIAPEFVTFSGGFRDSPEWGSAFIQVAWHQYLFSGDKNLLETYYEKMQAYIDYLKIKAENKILSYGLGDWRTLEQTPNAITATSIFYDDVVIMTKMAEILGKKDDAVEFSRLGEEIKRAFNETFFHPESKKYATGSQTSSAMPLMVGLVPEQYHKDVFNHLCDSLSANGLKTGEIGFPYLLRALSKGQRQDLIFKMINQTDKPGYGFQLNYGVTSLPEDWDFQPTASQNHFMLGHITEWFYRGLAGIQYDEDTVGFKKIVIKPGLISDLNWVNASYNSLYGLIESHWRLENHKVLMNITIPVNTTALVYVPAAAVETVTEGGKPTLSAEGIEFLGMKAGSALFSVGSGNYRFESEWHPVQ